MRRIGLASIVSALLFFTMAGCASTGTKSSESRWIQDLLTREEIQEIDVGNLYDAVARLRPRWMVVRGGARSHGKGTSILVYQGQVLLGNVEMLRTLSPNSIESLRYLDAATASASLPGRRDQHVAGAIVITPITVRH